MYKTVYVLLVMGCLLLLSSTAIMAQSHPPRTQTVHSINDFAELDPPVVPPIIDGFFESGDAWTYSSRQVPVQMSQPAVSGGSGMIRLWIRMIWFPRESLKVMMNRSTQMTCRTGSG